MLVPLRFVLLPGQIQMHIMQVSLALPRFRMPSLTQNSYTTWDVTAELEDSGLRRCIYSLPGIPRPFSLLWFWFSTHLVASPYHYHSVPKFTVLPT
jgi:hypothetical protein